MPAPRTIHLALLLIVAVALTGAGCGGKDPTSPKPGTITITSTPADLNAGWTLTGPDGYDLAGAGDQTIENLLPGDYTVAWADIATWQTPATTTATLSTEGEINFNAIYLRVPVASPDAVMAYFDAAYGGRDLALYEYLLGADFLFVDQNAGSNDRDQEIAIADPMFHEQPGEDSIVIGDITVNQLTPQGNWTDPPANDPNFGAFADSLYRPYIVDFSFHVAGQNLILRVQGPVLFYVMNDPSQGAASYKLLGMVDATYGNKATEDHSWTSVRSLFD